MIPALKPIMHRDAEYDVTPWLTALDSNIMLEQFEAVVQGSPLSSDDDLEELLWQSSNSSDIGKLHPHRRRKSCQRPSGADQKRQAFSKRKRGLVLKAYQLYKLTDAKVFMFVVNDKGSSWAYATPGFGAALTPAHLRQMREHAGLPHTPKHITEVMAHQKFDEVDRSVEDRHVYLNGVKTQVDFVHLASGAVPDPSTDAPSSAPPVMLGAQQTIPVQVQVPQPGHALPGALQFQVPGVQAAPALDPSQSDGVVTPSGRRLAASVGINLPLGSAGDLDKEAGPLDAAARRSMYMMEGGDGGSGGVDKPQASATLHSTGSDTLSLPLRNRQAAHEQVVTDAAGNIYRIVQEQAVLEAATQYMQTHHQQQQQQQLQQQQQQQLQKQQQQHQQQQLQLQPAASQSHMQMHQQQPQQMHCSTPSVLLQSGNMLGQGGGLAAAAASAQQMHKLHAAFGNYMHSLGRGIQSAEDLQWQQLHR